MRSGDDKISVSSSELGNSLGISQQSASRYLRELEDSDLIKRTNAGKIYEIQLTPKGFDTLKGIYLNLKGFIETKKSIDGTVITGIGEGAYYVGKYSEKIEETLGINPFRGTLNIKVVEGIIDLERFTSGMIGEFKMNGRTFGAIKFAPIRLLLDKKKEDCYLIVPKRTHHRDEVEIISEFNLREKLGLKDGDNVRIELST